MTFFHMLQVILRLVVTLDHRAAFLLFFCIFGEGMLVVARMPTTPRHNFRLPERLLAVRSRLLAPLLLELSLFLDRLLASHFFF